MPKSPAFIRVKEQVLQIVAAIPEARVSTFQSIGEHLDVVPRHVAYILSQLSPNEKTFYPWHRVVSQDGSLGAAKRNPDGRSQADLLADEGILIADNRLALTLSRVIVPAGELQSGIAKQTRPAQRPTSRSKVAAKPMPK